MCHQQQRQQTGATGQAGLAAAQQWTWALLLTQKRHSLLDSNPHKVGTKNTFLRNSVNFVFVERL
jgi:hypothetical protein